MRTAILYDWLVTQAGGEHVLADLLEAYPSPVYTLFHDPAAMRGGPMEKAEIHASFLQRLPFATRLYRNYLPFFPAAIEQFDLSAYEAVLSISHAVAKGALVRPDQMHVCYCLTPMRYAWDLYHEYLRNLGPVRKLAAAMVLSRMRTWDVASAGRVDYFAAISKTVAERIRRIYGRSSVVIYPPVDVDHFALSPKRGDYFVTVSRLVPYKRVDIIVEAFSSLGLPLVIVGDGPEHARLASKAAANVRFLGRADAGKVRQVVSGARAFVFAAEEDFGIAPVEAQACGVPVVAFGRGGLTETIVDGETGLFFAEQSSAALRETVARFMKMEAGFDPERIRHNAERFSKKRFLKEFRNFFSDCQEDFERKGRRSGNRAGALSV